MTSVTEGLDLDVDRGPNWLFVKLQPSRRAVLESPHVADEVWSISKRHFIYRLVLDLEQLESFPEGMMGQIAVQVGLVTSEHLIIHVAMKLLVEIVLIH